MKKDNAKRITLYVDEETYKQFQIYAITINKSVSSLIEQHMKEILKEIEKENK